MTLEGERLKSVTLRPGETKQLFTMHGPFLFGREFPCGESTELSVVLATKIGESIERKYRLVSKDPDDRQKACKKHIKSQ